MFLNGKLERANELLYTSTSLLTEHAILHEAPELEVWHKLRRQAEEANMEEMLETLDPSTLTKEQFDKLDALLTEIAE